MASRKGSRRSSRRTNRRSSRKNRRSSRKNRRTNRRNRKSQRGGAYNPMELSLAQGQEFQERHVNQHGGGGYQAGGYAPVGDQGLLPADLRTMARVSPLDGALEQIKGMSDLPQPEVPKQSGGGMNIPPPPPNSRRRRNGRRNGRKSMNRRGRKNTRRCWTRRGQRGGGAQLLGAPYNAPAMLLTPAEAARAGTADFSDPLLKGR
jgi:hypothetical protein